MLPFCGEIKPRIDPVVETASKKRWGSLLDFFELHFPQQATRLSGSSVPPFEIGWT
jgi:hypothetical protein